METAYLTMWPEVIAQKQLLARAQAIISRDYCREILPDLEQHISYMPSIPTLRNVIAQLIRAERCLLENTVREDKNLKSRIGLSNKERTAVFDGFLSGYDRLGSDILLADQEMYRRMKKISPEDAKSGRANLDFLGQMLEDEFFKSVSRYADMLERDSTGLSLADYIASESISAEASQLAAKKDLAQILGNGITRRVAFDVGELYAHRKFRNLHNVLDGILPLPAEYAQNS